MLNDAYVRKELQKRTQLSNKYVTMALM